MFSEPFWLFFIKCTKKHLDRDYAPLVQHIFFTIRRHSSANFHRTVAPFSAGRDEPLRSGRAHVSSPHLLFFWGCLFVALTRSYCRVCACLPASGWSESSQNRHLSVFWREETEAIGEGSRWPEAGCHHAAGKYSILQFWTIFTGVEQVKS